MMGNKREAILVPEADDSETRQPVRAANAKAIWKEISLGAVSTISYGYTESAQSEPVGPRFLRITDIQGDKVDWDTVPYCRIEKSVLPKYLLASGDIVFARTGATTGKSFLVVDPPNAVFASYLIRLRLLDNNILSEFVSLFFQTAGYWETIKAGISGSAQGGFNATKLAALSIPIPPLPEQRRIVGILDEAFAGLEAMRANAEKNLQNARAVFDNRLRSLFYGNNVEWKDTTIGEQMMLQRGFDITKDQQVAGNVPVVSSGGIKSFHNVAMVNGPGVVIGRKGTLGKVFYLQEDFWPHDTTLWVKNFKGNDSKFVYYFLRTLDAVRLDSGAANPALNRNQVHPLPIRWPPFSFQNEIAEGLDNLESETQRLAALYEQELEKLDELKKSLLHNAFSGNL